MLKYIVILLLIFAIIVLGQQAYFQGIGKLAYQKITGWGSAVWQTCKTLFEKHILGKVTSEIEKRQDIVKQEIKDQTKEVGQDIWSKIKNYFGGIFNSITGQKATQ